LRQRRRQFSAAVPGRGRGQCFGRRSARPGTAMPADGRMDPHLSRDDELRMLEEEEQMIKQQLEEVSAAVEALRKKNEKEVE
jgi:hypothetical protein